MKRIFTTFIPAAICLTLSATAQQAVEERTPLQDYITAVVDGDQDDDLETAADYRRHVEARFFGDIMEEHDLPGHITTATLHDIFTQNDIPLPSAYLGVSAEMWLTDLTQQHAIYVFEKRSGYWPDFFIQFGPSGMQPPGLWGISKENDRYLSLWLRGHSFSSNPTYDLLNPLARFTADFSCSRGPIGTATFCPMD